MDTKKPTRVGMGSLDSTTASWLEHRERRDFAFAYTRDMDREAFRELQRYQGTVNEQYRTTLRTWGYVAKLANL